MQIYLLTLGHPPVMYGQNFPTVAPLQKVGSFRKRFVGKIDSCKEVCWKAASRAYTDTWGGGGGGGDGGWFLDILNFSQRNIQVH